MRVLYFLAHSNGIGGAAKQMMAHAYVVKNRGHVVRIIVQCDEKEKYDKEYDRLLPVYGLKYTVCKYPISTCIEEIDIESAYRSTAYLRKEITEFNPDLIHSLQLNIGVEIIAREQNIPHVNSIYQISAGMFNIRWENMFPMYHVADSHYYCNQWSNGIKVRSECIRVIYNNTRSKDEVLVQHERCFELINVAYFTNCKRQKEILKFILMCKNNGLSVHIRFLGYDTGAYADECREYVNVNGLNDLVTFEGYVPDVESYFCSADLMIHASTVESYPGVIVEAMANHLPVLSTPVAGVPELLRDGLNGFLTEGYEAESIYEKFLSYVETKKTGKIEEIKDSAYNTYLENHTYSVVGECLENYYRDIINKHIGKYSFEETSVIIDNIRRFYQEKKLERYSEYTKKHCWYLYHLKETCRDLSTAMIWGTGNYSEVGVEWCEILGICIKGFIDSNRTGNKQGYRIYPPVEEVIGSVDCVIVSVVNTRYVEEIMTTLEEKGYVRNVNYFLIHNDPCLMPVLR